MTGSAVAGRHRCSRDGRIHKLAGRFRSRFTRGVSPGENVVPQGAEAPPAACCWIAEPGSTKPQSRWRLPWANRGCKYLCDRGSRFLPRAMKSSKSQLIPVRRRFATPTAIRSRPRSRAAGGGTRALADRSRRAAQAAALMEQGMKSDLLIMTGGVSMGRYDLVEQVLAEMQAEFFFTGAKIQPGKPVVFGRVLPGAWRPRGPKPRTNIFSAFREIQSRPW